MVAHYISHTINTNDGDIFQMVPWTCVCVCIMTIIEWFYQSIYTLMEWFNYSISMPLYCQYLSHPIEIDKGDCEFYCWIIEITNNVMNAGRKCVFSLRKPAPRICNNCSQRVIAEPESKSIAKCPLGYCVCTKKTKYSGYCVITSGHFNGVFNLHATEDISGIDFWWTKEIVCSLPLSMIKRLARWINRVSTCYFFLLVDSINETDLPAQVCIHPTVQWLCQYPGTSSSLILSLSVTSSWI